MSHSTRLPSTSQSFVSKVTIFFFLCKAAIIMLSALSAYPESIHLFFRLEDCRHVLCPISTTSGGVFSLICLSLSLLHLYLNCWYKIIPNLNLFNLSKSSHWLILTVMITSICFALVCYTHDSIVLILPFVSL